MKFHVYLVRSFLGCISAVKNNLEVFFAPSGRSK